MKSTTNIQNKDNKKNSNISSRIRSFLGAEFLLKKEMRPWYFYFSFVILLTTCLVISEQRINAKKEKIHELENTYKLEISKLKANNQFIPYEENQILIQKMKDRGYVLDEEHNYTITIHEEQVDKRHHLFKRKNKKPNE